MAWQDPNNPQNRYQGTQGGAYTSGGPPEVGSTYGQYAPQTFGAQAQQSAFNPAAQASAPWIQTSTPAQAKAATANYQPPQQSWATQTAQWQTAQPTYQQPAAQQGYTPQGYSQPNQAWVQPGTAAPFGGWNQQQAQQGQASNPSQALQDAYRRYLGRDASAQEIAARVNQRGFNLAEHIEGIARSPEAYSNYQRQQQGGAPAASGGYDGRGMLPGENSGIAAYQPDGPPDGGYRSSGDRTSDAIAQAYQQALGRNPSAQEVAGWRNNPNAVAEIRGSDEARRRGMAMGGGGVSPNANTDGFAAPGWVAQRPTGTPPPGWDRAKWSDPNHQTPKYVIGRILSQYQPGVQSAAQAAQEIARAYPGSQFNGKDKISVPGVGTIDVLQNSGSGQNMNWQFGVEGGGDGEGGGGQAGGYDPMSQMMQLLMMQQQGGGGYAVDPRQAQEMAAMRQQLAQFQQQNDLYKQQQQSMQAQQAAAAQAARNRGPQFSYF